MTTASNREFLTNRFRDNENADLSTKWAVNQRSLVRPAYGETVSSLTTDLMYGVAVSLGRAGRFGAWLELRESSQHDAHTALELNIIQRRIDKKIGESALVDTVTLIPGDVFTIGRYKYPNINPMVSRKHLQVSVDSPFRHGAQLDVTVEDMGSENGTYLYETPAPTRKLYDDYDPYAGADEDEDEPAEQPFFKASYEQPKADQRHEQSAPDPVEALMKRYGTRFTSLSYIDFSVASSVADHLRSQYQGAHNKTRLERELNKQLHPDRMAHPDKKIAHEMFLLAKDLLGLN